jgi:octaprenyl-diphosphate synthase
MDLRLCAADFLFDLPWAEFNTYSYSRGRGRINRRKKPLTRRRGFCIKARRENAPVEQFIDLIKDDMQKVEEEFQTRLVSQVPRLTEMAKKQLKEGKRFRPALLLLTARLCGYQGKDHIPLAAVIEFIHTATLLHDDVIDNAEVRRGRPSANRQVDNRNSVLTGDFLFCKSLAMGIEVGNLRILQALIAVTTALAEGEAMEMEQTGNLTLTEEENQRLIINKTAVLISAAMRIGAILGEALPSIEEALAYYGLQVGISFQLVDDCLDYIGDQEVWQKKIGIDLKERKITLPLIHTLAHCAPKEKKEVEEIILGNGISPSALQRVTALITKYKGFNYTFTKAQRHIEEGKERLQILPPSREKEALFAGADYVVRRRV